MKNQLLKLMFVVACLGVMFSGCEKDTTEVYVVSELPFSSRVVSLDEIPEIADYMNKNIYGYSFRSILNDGEPVYDNKKIIETIDKEGKTNYIISFINDETLNNEFYNLIINVFPNGERKSYVAKYICDTSAYDKFASHNFNFYYFKGVVEFTSIKTTTNRSGPCPPFITTIDANNEAGTNSNTNSQFTNSPNSQIINQTLGYNSYSLTIYFTGGSGNGGHVYNQGDSDGTPCNCYQPLRREININPTFTEPCPDPLPQGYITPNISQAAINNLKITLGLTNPQWRWFTSAGNEDKFEPFYLAYMSDPTKNTPETKAFFKESLDRMIAEPDVFTSITPFIIEKNINYDALDTCTKGVLNSLKSLQQTDMAKIFAKLNNPNFIQKPSYSTTFALGNPANPDAFASTNWVTIPNATGPQPSQAPSPFNYEIKIRPSYLDGSLLGGSSPTKLSIARTILHEIIHAYFDSLFDDCYYYGNCTNIKQFPDLWSDYEHRYLNIPSSTPVTDPQHLTIANNFVTILASALQEYQTGVPVANNAQPDQDYKDLAWQGLQGKQNPPFDTMNYIFSLEYPLGSDKRIRFDNINAAEDSQTSAFQVTPKSTPCN